MRAQGMIEALNAMIIQASAFSPAGKIAVKQSAWVVELKCFTFNLLAVYAALVCVAPLPIIH